MTQPSALRLPPSPEALAQHLARVVAVRPLVARVLVARGLHEPARAHHFLHPRLADLTRPDAMADRDFAADRLAHAVKQGERIAVYGDYNVDGLTSAALLTRALRALGGEVVPFSASRFDGGYGLSDVALDRVLAASPSLLVTLDCGTSDHPRLDRARAAGLDAIVIDHHKVPDAPLPALAFLNPHRPGCGFPFKHLASVGLAFSVAAALRARLGAALDLRPYLDLVALGTIADVAPLVGDNRVLVRAGLGRIADGQGSPGVRALVHEARLKHRLTARDVGFSLAPMLNAPGRLGSPAPTLALLLAERDADAARAAAELAAANTKRKEISSALFTAALAQVRAVYGDILPAAVVVAGDGWHAGMGGIVASRLVDQLGVAVAVVAMEGEEGVGSVRAPRGTRLYDAVHACRDGLVRYGGHDGAAGLTVTRGRVETLRAAFADAVASMPRSEARPDAPEAELTEADLMPGLANDLGLLDPLGEGNPEARVVVHDARVADARPVGEGHLRVSFGIGRRFVQAFVRDGAALRARGGLPLVGARVTVHATLRPDPWQGPEAVQLDNLRFVGADPS